MIKTEQLRYLVELDRTNSFHKCAENLYLSQPAISLSIRNLEKELGVTLFTRTSTGVYPTEIGTKVIQQAKEVLLHMNGIRTLCKEYNSTQNDFILKQLEIYASETISSIILPHVIPELQKKFPTAMFSFHQCTLDGLFSELAKNPYSIGFYYSWADECEELLKQYPTIKADQLSPLSFHLATAKSAPFRPKTAIQLDNNDNGELKIPFVSYAKNMDTTNQVIQQLLDQHILQLVFEAPTGKLFNMYINQGLAAGVISGLGNDKFISSNDEMAQLVFTPIETERKSYLFLFYNKKLPTGLHQLLQQYIKTRLIML